MTGVTYRRVNAAAAGSPSKRITGVVSDGISRRVGIGQTLGVLLLEGDETGVLLLEGGDRFALDGEVTDTTATAGNSKRVA